MSQLNRFASQLTFCSPSKVLRRAMIEQDEDQCVTHIFSLDDEVVESAHTLFFDGVISVGLVSLNQSISDFQLELLSTEYQYVDLSMECDLYIEKQTNKKLILDFGTVQTNEVNKKLQYYASQLSQFSLVEIIAACTYYPLLALGRAAELAENERFNLLIWENVDLLNKNITDLTAIRRL